jgi:predicted amino acid racemase
MMYSKVTTLIMKKFPAYGNYLFTSDMTCYVLQKIQVVQDKLEKHAGFWLRWIRRCHSSSETLFYICLEL